MRKMLTALALCAAVGVLTAQVQVPVPPYAPISITPASAVNGAGVMTTGLTFSPTNTFDIGTNTTTLAPRTVYAGTNVIAGTNIAMGGSVIGGVGATLTRLNLATTDGQAFFANNASTSVLRLNVTGAPALSSCGDGALDTGSTNTSGRVNATNATACTLTFSTAFPGSSADCLIENITANRGNVTASSASAFTVSNLTAGDDFMYHCLGR